MPTPNPPRIVLLAGPNGAGKTTAAQHLLMGPAQVEEFINADIIATGLSAFHPESVAFEAGRVMLHRLHKLAEQRKSFAAETTLASRSYASWIRELRMVGYEFHLFYLWLPSAEMAISRVARRVLAGGHNVPEETIRVRYSRGLKNLRELYLPLADSWRIVDNTNEASPQTVASGSAGESPQILDSLGWSLLKLNDLDP